MGDVSSDHSQTSGDGAVDETMLPKREPISAGGEHDLLGMSFSLGVCEDKYGVLTRLLRPFFLRRNTKHRATRTFTAGRAIDK
jgi:hypothetical protein